jgi:hypothetical protein
MWEWNPMRRSLHRGSIHPAGRAKPSRQIAIARAAAFSTALWAGIFAILGWAVDYSLPAWLLASILLSIFVTHIFVLRLLAAGSGGDDAAFTAWSADDRTGSSVENASGPGEEQSDKNSSSAGNCLERSALKSGAGARPNKPLERTALTYEITLIRPASALSIKGGLSGRKQRC